MAIEIHYRDFPFVQRKNEDVEENKIDDDD